MLGPLPCLARRDAWLVARLDPTRCPAAVAERGGGTVGAHRALLGALAQRGVTRVLAEGGAGIAAGLLRAGLVDRIAWFHAPGVMGGDGLPAVRPLPLTSLSAMPRFRRVAGRAAGADWFTEFEREDSEPPCSQGS